MKYLLSVIALALLAACASRPPAADKPLTLEQKLEKAGYELGGEVDSIQSWQVDGWNRIDDQHAVFNSGPSRDYLVTLQTPCRGLASAETIGFTATVDQVTHFDKLVVHDIGFTDQCQIDSLHKLKRLKKE